MIRWGLPSRLVTDNIGGGSLPQVPLRPGQFFKKWPVHVRLAWHQTRVVGQTARVIERLQKLGQRASGGDLQTCLDCLQDIYVTLVHQMMALTANMSIPLSLLRAVGTSPRFEVESTRMVHDLEPLRNLDPGSQLFQERVQQYVARHGHRGAFESDIARPRICDDPLAWVQPMLNYKPSPVAPLSWRARLAQPLVWWAAPAVKAREDLRSQAMKAFLQVRRRLLQLALEQGLIAQQLWWLDPHELLTSAFEAKGFWEQRQAELERLEGSPLPDLISSFDDLENFTAVPSLSGSRLSGLPLTRGRVRGRAWVCSEPGAPPQHDGPLILVARAIDPGWLPCLTQATGVAIEIGGDLSHGSILLREMGLPAVTNLRGLWGWVAQGEWLELNADQGSLSRCEPPT
jgi:phosphohistidine swiveling domain-containing protein